MLHVLHPCSDEGLLDCFHFLAVMNRAIVNLVRQVCLMQDDGAFGYAPQSGGMAGS